MNFVFVADVAGDAVVPNQELDEYRWVRIPPIVIARSAPS
jgi:hypothetical protein